MKVIAAGTGDPSLVHSCAWTMITALAAESFHDPSGNGEVGWSGGASRPPWSHPSRSSLKCRGNSCSLSVRERLRNSF